jgi:hypothetical protein
MVERAIAESAPVKRRNLFEGALIYISEQAYTVPLYTNPVSFVFHNDLTYDSGLLPFPDLTRLRLGITRQD